MILKILAGLSRSLPLVNFSPKVISLISLGDKTTSLQSSDSMFKNSRVSFGVFRAKLIFSEKKMQVHGNIFLLHNFKIQYALRMQSHALSYPSPETHVIPMCMNMAVKVEFVY